MLCLCLNELARVCLLTKNQSLALKSNSDEVISTKLFQQNLCLARPMQYSFLVKCIS